MRNIKWLDKIVDILIVIVGILAALGLESWYEDKKEEETEQQYITTILEDISLDIIELEKDLQFTNEQHQSLLSVLRIIQEQDTSKVDSILNHTIHFGNFKEFTPHSTIYKSLVQSGEINVIKNYSLKEDLGRLHLNSYNRVSDAEKVYIDFYMNLLNFLTIHFNYLTGNVSNQEDFYEMEFTNLIVALQSATQQKLLHYDAAIQKSSKVKEQLEGEKDN